jgi:hypothetical protein
VAAQSAGGFLSGAQGWVRQDRDHLYDNLLQTNEFRTGLNAQWPFFSDNDRKVQKDLDIQEYTDPHHNPMIPYTVVLKPGLEIFKIYNGYWFFGRPTIENLREDLRETTMDIRPDWDLATLGMREAWDADEKANFYPYPTSQR